MILIDANLLLSAKFSGKTLLCPAEPTYPLAHVRERAYSDGREDRPEAYPHENLSKADHFRDDRRRS